MVRGGANIHLFLQVLVWVSCVLVNVSAGHPGVSGRSGSAETLPEGRDGGTRREPCGPDPGGWRPPSDTSSSIMADETAL